MSFGSLPPFYPHNLCPDICGEFALQWIRYLPKWPGFWRQPTTKNIKTAQTAKHENINFFGKSLLCKFYHSLIIVVLAVVIMFIFIKITILINSIISIIITILIILISIIIIAISIVIIIVISITILLQSAKGVLCIDSCLSHVTQRPIH